SDSRHRGASPPKKESFNSRTLSQKAVSFSSSSPPSSRTTASTDDSAPDRRRQLLPSAHQAALIGQGRADQRLKPAMASSSEHSCMSVLPARGIGSTFMLTSSSIPSVPQAPA